MGKKIYNNGLVRYTCLFIIIGLFSFFWFLYYGKTLLTNNDGFDQYYPIIVNLRHLIRDVSHGKGFSFWDWSIGLGADRIGNFYSVYFDPFSYIIALFPLPKMDIGFGIAVYARLYTAGITMFLFLKHRKMEVYQCVIGALSYSLCMWAMYSFFQMVFLLPFILFPLLIIALDRVDEGKSPIYFIIILAVILITNLYFAYMTAIITAIYFLIKYPFTAYSKSIKCFFIRSIRIICYIILAALIASPVIMIVGYTIMNSPKGDYSLTRILFTLPDILKFIPSFVSDTQFFGNYSALSCGPLIFAMTPAFFTNIRKGTIKPSIIMVWLCIIFIFFPCFDSIMNGFNYPTARWGYMFAFFYIWAGCEAFPKVVFGDRPYKDKYIKGSVILFALVLVSISIAMIFGLLSTKNVVIVLVYMVVMLITITILMSDHTKTDYDKRKNKLVQITVISICLINFLHFSSILSGGFSEYMTQGQAYEQYKKSVLKDAECFENDLYRVDAVEHITDSNQSDYYTLFHWAANEPTFFGVPSTYTYYSTLDSDWAEFNKTVCNNNGFMLRVLSYANDGRSRLNFLEDVKYFVASSQSLNQYCSYGFYLNDALSSDNRSVYKNAYNTSIGYVYQSVIKQSDFAKLDYLDREQIMMQAAVIEDNENATEASSFDLDKYESDTQKVEFSIDENEGVSFEDDIIKVLKPNASIKLSFDQIKNSEIYVYLENFRRIPVSAEERKNEYFSQNHSRLENDTFRLNHIKYKPAEDFSIGVKSGSIQKNIVSQNGLNNQANTEVRDYLCNIGYFDLSPDSITITFANAGEYQYDSLDVLSVSQRNFDNQAKALADQRFAVDYYNNDVIQGTVDSDGGVLYLSILNTDGWKAYVDGERVDIYPVNTGFIGLDIAPGKHDIRLVYSPVGVPVTCYLSVIGIIILFVVSGIRRKRR